MRSTIIVYCHIFHSFFNSFHQITPSLLNFLVLSFSLCAAVWQNSSASGCEQRQPGGCSSPLSGWSQHRGRHQCESAHSFLLSADSHYVTVHVPWPPPLDRKAIVSSASKIERSLFSFTWMAYRSVRLFTAEQNSVWYPLRNVALNIMWHSLSGIHD